MRGDVIEEEANAITLDTLMSASVSWITVAAVIFDFDHC